MIIPANKRDEAARLAPSATVVTNSLPVFGCKLEQITIVSTSFKSVSMSLSILLSLSYIYVAYQFIKRIAKTITNSRIGFNYLCLHHHFSSLVSLYSNRKVPAHYFIFTIIPSALGVVLLQWINAKLICCQLQNCP